MKILIALYDILDLGGIILNTEGLCCGLRELGHKVKVVCLYWKESVQPSTSKRSGDKSTFGGEYDQRHGWTRMPRFAYKGEENLKRWKDYASKFDLIIWQIPVPSKAKSNQSNTDWIELYNVPVKQIVYIHDGNMIKQYPHIQLIADKLTGAVGVHPCAYNSLIHLPVKRAMAFSPQMNMEERLKATRESDKERNGFFSLQTWKAWKHVDDIVRAIPYMGEYSKRMAGEGIEYHYMTSKEKMPEKYLSKGVPIWDTALKHGMKHYGFVNNNRREKLLHGSIALIDPSWSYSYAKFGDHFNRVIIDGIIGGCVPIARNLGVSTNQKGIGEIFKPNQNYLMIPHDTNPKEFAALVNDYLSPTNKKIRSKIISAGLELLPHFSYIETAYTFINLANDKPAGYYKNISTGRSNTKMKSNANYLLNNFFNDRSKSRGFLTR